MTAARGGTRRPRIVCLLLALHAVWNAWCAAQQYAYGNVPCAAIFFLFSLVPVVALVLQSEFDDLHDALRYYRAREARTTQDGIPGVHRARPRRRGPPAMSVCALCREAGLTPGQPHTCREPQFAEMVFTRHRGRGITIDTAPARTRISVQALVDKYSYLHMPRPDVVVFADQVVYRVAGYDPVLSALELELLEDMRPAAPSEEQPDG
ncbi:hypothetical protein AB0912_15460 [Streptomyces sp. NPDC007084]|uniref:hypothetical protein n=1 Tax=Streptomyces sp. NPDC007084 TaxID=3154313 RepID=UPI003455F298